VSDVGAITVDNLTFTYPPELVALDQVSLQVNIGETVGLVGPNGAGKTTLFLCLAGVLPVPQGKVLVAGLDPGRREERRQLPTKVGLIFQNSDDQIFNATVLDDVAFGPLNLGLPRAKIAAEVAEALAGVGLSGYEERVPFHLSGGEKRRVALAGVLAMRPDILLLDEPTMFLDPRGRRELLHLLKGLSATRLIATHDLEAVLELCQRVILLDHGRVIAAGPPAQLFIDADLMEGHGLEVPHSLRPR
jgi:cobalt/nickel transport system ATP-binding protein